jgi:nucleoside-diphosphate-sugar epimerase
VRVLLIGYGFVGSAVAKLLSAAGHELTVLRRSVANAERGIEFVACDLRNRQPWQTKRQFDAAIVVLAPGERSDEAYAATYCRAQQNLQSAIDTQRYIYVSSTAVYPEAEGTWREEDARAHSTRAQLLLEAEAIARRIPHAAILRFAGLYNRDRRIYYGPPATPSADRLVHFLHRDDAARAILHALTQGLEGVFNVHDGNPQWRSDILHRLGFLTAPLQHEYKRYISAEKFFATGFRPSYRDYFTGLDF